MNFKYKRELSMIGIMLVLIFGVFATVKTYFFSDISVTEPLKVVMQKKKTNTNETKYAMATTKNVIGTSTQLTTTVKSLDEEIETIEEEKYENPYTIAPTIVDDGSIVWDGLTTTELTNKLNKSLNGYLTNTGYFFAKFTRETGLDPYLSVAIVLLETGCKWSCSSLTVKCNNIGGLKGGPSCNGGSYKKYDSLEEGINGYLNIIYNNYYLKGMTDQYLMASTYAASNMWTEKVTNYINEIKAK